MPRPIEDLRPPWLPAVISGTPLQALCPGLALPHFRTEGASGRQESGHVGAKRCLWDQIPAPTPPADPSPGRQHAACAFMKRTTVQKFKKNSSLESTPLPDPPYRKVLLPTEGGWRRREGQDRKETEKITVLLSQETRATWDFTLFRSRVASPGLYVVLKVLE